MKESQWNEIKEFYKERFGINPEIVDLMASNDVLLMSVSGSSNKSISTLLDIDESYVKDILSTVLDFEGWDTDLSISPYLIYERLSNATSKSGYPLFREFTEEISVIHDFDSVDSLKTMFRICRIYDKISELIDKEWF